MEPVVSASPTDTGQRVLRVLVWIGLAVAALLTVPALRVLGHHTGWLGLLIVIGGALAIRRAAPWLAQQTDAVFWGSLLAAFLLSRIATIA